MIIAYWYGSGPKVQGAEAFILHDWDWQDLGWWPSECVWIVPGTIERIETIVRFEAATRNFLTSQGDIAQQSCVCDADATL